MPECADAVTVVVIPPPTANGPLHVGHLSGPYLAADVAARAARLRGERVLALGGIDVHQNYVLTRAENDGVAVDDLITGFRRRIAEAYELARIEPDITLNPTDPRSQRAVAQLVDELVADGTFALRALTLLACEDCGRTLHHSYVVGTCSRCGVPASGGSCEGCGGFTSAADLLDPSCARCGGVPRPFAATVPVLDLNQFREPLLSFWARARLSPRVRDLVAGYLEDGLPAVPIAYPTNWGVRGVGSLDGLRLDVYAELGLSTFDAVARALDPSSATLGDHRTAWAEVGQLWHFNGIDNAFYCALFWPAVYLAAGVTPRQLAGTVVNEFFTLDGAKFSTSRNHAIWADEFLCTEDPEIVRLFLAWERPGEYATDFTMSAFEAFRQWVRPLLAGHATSASNTPAIATEVTRGERALHPRTFDPALAVRCLFNALRAGADAASVQNLRHALGGAVAAGLGSL